MRNHTALVLSATLTVTKQFVKSCYYIARHGQALSWALALNASQNPLERTASRIASAKEFLLTGGAIVNTKVRGGRRTSSGLDWLDRSLKFGLGELAKIWFSTKHKRRMKRTAVCSPASVLKGCTGRPGWVAPSEGRMKWKSTTSPQCAT